MSRPGVTADRPQPLPAQVSLRPGESVDALVRRLAQANHLRPSYLRVYLNAPPHHLGSVRPQRLALVSGRTLDTILHVYPQLRTATRQRGAPGPQPDDLPTAIQREAATSKLVDTLSTRFAVRRLTIIQALTGQPPHERIQARSNPILEDHKAHIEALISAEPRLTSWRIWRTLIEDHQATASYGTVRDYVRRARLQIAHPHADQLMSNRAVLFAAIRQESGNHDLVANLSEMFAVDRDTVLQALTGKIALPRPTPKRTPILQELQTHIDAMIASDPPVTITRIWERLIDEHHAEVSYATVRDYVTRERAVDDTTRPAASATGSDRAETSAHPDVRGSV